MDIANLTFSVISRGCDCKSNIEKRKSTRNKEVTSSKLAYLLFSARSLRLLTLAVLWRECGLEGRGLSCTVRDGTKKRLVFSRNHNAQHPR